MADILGTNTDEKVSNDLWFYSNPIFAYPKQKSHHNNESISKKDNEEKLKSIVESIEVYPNPTEGIIRFDNLPDNYVVKAEIYNVNGQIVLSQKIENSQLNISNLPKGMYLVKVNLNGVEKSVKLRKI